MRSPGLTRAIPPARPLTRPGGTIRIFRYITWRTTIIPPAAAERINKYIPPADLPGRQAGPRFLPHLGRPPSGFPTRMTGNRNARARGRLFRALSAHPSGAATMALTGLGDHRNTGVAIFLSPLARSLVLPVLVLASPPPASAKLLRIGAQRQEHGAPPLAFRDRRLSKRAAAATAKSWPTQPQASRIPATSQPRPPLFQIAGAESPPTAITDAVASEEIDLAAGPAEAYIPPKG